MTQAAHMGAQNAHKRKAGYYFYIQHMSKNPFWIRDPKIFPRDAFQEVGETDARPRG